MGLLPSLSTLLIQGAALVFFHAAYSAWEAQSLAKAADIVRPTFLASPLPLDILVELFVAFALLLIGVAWSAPGLKEISWASEMKKRSIDSEDSRVGFASLRHRGGVLFPSEE
ncbi:membrane magnesium transporter 1-like [Pseudohyphozyma bogoriensis]|nr:membrane magnesium transporter 1-like [Pseudohyphozyma bogoriensis]